MNVSALAIISESLSAVLSGSRIDLPSATALSLLRGSDLWDLFAAAGHIREHFRGTSINICSIVNAKSGACTEDCAYCAQSVLHDTGAPVYPLIAVTDIVKAAQSARENGAKRFCIVTSGRGIDSREDLETIARGVGEVRSIGLSPCATLGTLTREQLSFLKSAGLDRYHHNIETSRDYFPRVCTTHTFDERLEVLRHAHSLGLSACSGGILGMGETMQDRVNMAFTLRELDVDSVPVNFLMPISGTPLEHAAFISPMDALHAIALFRFIMPEKEIRICAGRGTVLRSLHPFIFTAGADGFMIGNYLTTSGLDPAEDLAMIRDLGLQA
jgi:biotin synthase